MVVTSDKPTPYAPASAIVELIERHRKRGLPSPVDAEVLGRAGISESLIPRTLKALQTLDLIDENGKPTEIFEGIRLASEAEYKERLAEWLNTAYTDVISFVDPATDDETAIRDAFRSYNPVAQQPRMVSLFVGLYAAAGIGSEKQAQPRQRTRSQAPRKPATKKQAPRKNPLTGGSSGLPQALVGLLSNLPSEGRGWTQDQRDKFLNTFGVVLDFCFQIKENEAVEADSEEEEQI